MLPDGGRPRRGLPRLTVAPRPGFHGSRSGSLVSRSGGRRFPTAGAARCGRSRRPSSQAVPAVRAPFAWSAVPERAVVGDDEEAGDSAGPGRGPGLIDQAQDQVVGGAPSRMADDQPGRDPLAAEARVGRPVEHELDADVCRDRATQPTDQRRRRHLIATAGERGQEVRAVDDQSIGGGERVARRCHRRIVRARTPTATIGRVSLLLLVDLDGVVYRGAEPDPWCRGRAGRSGRARRRHRLRHEQLDALPRRLRRAAVRHGLPGLRRSVSCRPRGRPLSTSSTTRRGSAASSWSVPADWSASCATSGWRWSPSGTPRPGCTRRASTAGRRPVRRMRS